MTIVNRRRFLQALGLGAASTTLPFWMRGATADDTTGPPKRLIILSSGHGTVWQHWHMNPWGHPDGVQWQESLTGVAEADWSRALRPLYRHRDRLVAVDGLSMASAELDLPGYRHEKGWIHAWTGSWVHFTGDDLFSTAPSLDQIVAAQIGRPDRLASVELSIHGGRPVCHAGLAQQLPLAEDPMAVFDRMFGAAGGASASQGSVLDYVLAEYDALAPKLSAWDRSRMEQHFDLVRALEQPSDRAQTQLPPLRPANMLIEGSIVAYESNVRTGGFGVRYLGIGPSDLYRQDQVTINLRAVDIRSGDIIQSVTTTKTVFSIQLDFGVFKFVSLRHLLEVETGLSRNEPVQQCVREAIEAGLIHLIAQGARDGSWNLKNPDDLKKPLLAGYLKAYDEQTMNTPITAAEQSKLSGEIHAQ